MIIRKPSISWLWKVLLLPGRIVDTHLQLPSDVRWIIVKYLLLLSVCVALSGCSSADDSEAGYSY